jgi:solute:Na+ symporter, SSS family
MVVASLFAAFISTVNTHLNWNASYAVNDIYKRFIAPAASEAECIRMSRFSVLGFAALAIVAAYFMTSIESGVLILFNLQAAVGMVLMLRWLWWRINAWSEISAMVASIVVTSLLPLISSYYGLDWSPATRILLTVLVVTPIWIATTLLTSPVDNTTLENFYRRVHPIRTFWKPIAARCPDVIHDDSILQAVVGWLVGAIGVLALSFAIGKVLLLEWSDAAWASAICLVCALVLRVNYLMQPLAWSPVASPSTLHGDQLPLSETKADPATH